MSETKTHPFIEKAKELLHPDKFKVLDLYWEQKKYREIEDFLHNLAYPEKLRDMLFKEIKTSNDLIEHNQTITELKELQSLYTMYMGFYIQMEC